MLSLILQAAGCAVVSIGLGLAWLPLGVIAAGASLILFGISYAIGKGE